MFIPRATVSAVSCLVVPAFICIDLLISPSRVLKINDDADDDDDDDNTYLARNYDPWATFLLLIVWAYLHANFSSWLRNTCV